MASNQLNSLELSHQWHKTLMFSSRQMNWNGILVEQCQSPASAFEMELPALSDHWLYFHTGDPALSDGHIFRYNKQYGIRKKPGIRESEKKQ